MVSGLGSQLTLVAVSFQAYALTRSTLVVGLIGLAQLVPLLAGALWGGTLADAMDRKKVLVLTQFAMATAVGGLVVNASLAHPAVWPLFVCTAAGAGFQGIDWPARRAALPMLVDEQDVTAAIALQTTIQQLALVAGPALAGVLIATDRAERGLRHRRGHVRGGPRRRAPPTGAGAERWRHADGTALDGRGVPPSARERLLSATYWIDLNAMIFGMPRAVFPALGVGLFGGGAGVVGLLYAAPGAGALLGSLFTGWCSRVRHQGRAIAACVVIWGVTIALFGIVPGAVDRTDAAGRGRCRRRGLGRVPPGRAAARRARAPPGTALGHVLRRGGRRAPLGRCRDRGGRRRRRARSSPCGRVGWPAWPAWPFCCGGFPSSGVMSVEAAPSASLLRPRLLPKSLRSWGRVSPCESGSRGAHRRGGSARAPLDPGAKRSNAGAQDAAGAIGTAPEHRGQSMLGVPESLGKLCDLGPRRGGVLF